ncbi:hypothetical protein D3C78_1299000 [compost metagenome]
MTVLIIELLEVVDIQHQQGHTTGSLAQRLFQQAGERRAVEQFGQAIEGRGQLRALQLVAQGLDFVLRRMQLREEVLLLALHQPGALLQFAEDARQAVTGRLVEHFQALPQAILKVEATLHTQ